MLSADDAVLLAGGGSRERNVTVRRPAGPGWANPVIVMLSRLKAGALAAVGRPEPVITEALPARSGRWPGGAA